MDSSNDNTASLVPRRGNQQMVSHTTGRTPPGLNTQLGLSVGPNRSISDMIGSLGASAYATPEMSHSSPIAGHMTARYSAQASQQAFTQSQEQEVLQKLAASSAGIRTPVTSVPASISDAPFATPTSSIWSPNPNQAPGQSIVTHNAGLWQQPSLDEGTISSEPLYHRHSDFAVNPYAERIDRISTAAPSPIVYAASGFGFPGHFEQQQQHFNPNLRLPMTSQGYPMSPHSEASEPSSVVCPPTLPDHSAHHNQPQTSPSVGGSSGSRRDSIGAQDPPRNGYNQIYCDHPECAANPPTFSRKCEWS